MLRLIEIRAGEIPVDQLPPRLDVLGSRGAIVNVVRMLPNVAGDYRRLTLAYRASSVLGRDDLQRTVLRAHQPCLSHAHPLPKRPSAISLNLRLT